MPVSSRPACLANGDTRYARRQPEQTVLYGVVQRELEGFLARARGEGPAEPPARTAEPSLRPRRLAWADLLRRVFAIDVLECPRCGARTRLLAALHPPDATSAILECLGLPARAPPVEAARPEEQSSQLQDPAFEHEGL